MVSRDTGGTTCCSEGGALFYRGIAASGDKSETDVTADADGGIASFGGFEAVDVGVGGDSAPFEGFVINEVVAAFEASEVSV